MRRLGIAWVLLHPKWWNWPLHQQTESLRDKDAPSTCATERVCPMCFLIREVKTEIPGKWNRRYRLRQLPTIRCCQTALALPLSLQRVEQCEEPRDEDQGKAHFLHSPAREALHKCFGSGINS